MFIVYDIIFICFAVLYFPYLVVRGKWHSGFKMRFGCLDPALGRKLDGSERIWVHAVSVGEVLAVTDLLRKVKEAYPKHAIICSTVTKTGNQLAKEQLGDSCIVIYAPLDFSWVVRKFIAVIKPVIYISTETEIWPNLYTALHKNGIPIFQINGRISDSAFKGYNRVRFLTKRVLGCVDRFCMQSALDAERVKQLGAVPEKVCIVGNLKFDNIPAATEIQKASLGLQENEDLLIAGSTHPGEEEILIDAYRELAAEFPDLRLVLAPRHIERADAVIDLVEKQGYRPVRFSRVGEHKSDARSVVVVDTIGHLRDLYSLASVVFVGKSLAVGGGQNMIEPASLGKPTLVGPMTQNFKDAVNIFLQSGALVEVRDSQELLTEARRLLSDPQSAKEIGEAARGVVEQYQGATAKTLDAIRERLA